MALIDEPRHGGHLCNAPAGLEQASGLHHPLADLERVRWDTHDRSELSDEMELRRTGSTGDVIERHVDRKVVLQVLRRGMNGTQIEPPRRFGVSGRREFGEVVQESSDTTLAVETRRHRSHCFVQLHETLGHDQPADFGIREVDLDSLIAGRDVGQLDHQQAPRPWFCGDRCTGVCRRWVEHHELVRGHGVPSASALEAVAGPSCDADDVFANGIYPITSGASLHPDQTLVLRSPPGRHLVDVFHHGIGRCKHVQAVATWLPVRSGPVITIHIIVHDAAAATDWYCSVLDAREEHRITLADGRLIDLQMRFGESKVVLADEFPEHDALSPKTTGASSAVFYLATDDVDALVARAVAAGAQLTRAAADWFTGDRDAQIIDPFGHRWGLTQHVRDVPRDEIERAAVKAFSGAES
jgi:PhnB protein